MTDIKTTRKITVDFQKLEEAVKKHDEERKEAYLKNFERVKKHDEEIQTIFDNVGKLIDKKNAEKLEAKKEAKRKQYEKEMKKLDGDDDLKRAFRSFLSDTISQMKKEEVDISELSSGKE